VSDLPRKPEPVDSHDRAKGIPREWFSTTHWSTVLEAADHASTRSVEALERLCRAYWYPLYAHVRQRGTEVEEAQDLTQEFFARFLAKGYLDQVRPERGRFRNYLLTALNHFLADEWDRRKRQKRGGGTPPLRIDAQAGEDLMRFEPVDTASPDRLYERRWAVALLNQVLDHLSEEYERAGKGRLFRVLQTFLVGDVAEPSYAQAGLELGMSEGALRIAVHRLRRRYAELFRLHIAHTVSDPTDIDDEMRHLLTVLGR